MAPVTRRRRPAPAKQDTTQDNIPESIFDALNLSSPDGQPVVATSHTKGSNDKKGPTTEDLMKQLADMQGKFEMLERSNMALATAAPVARVEAPKEPQLNLDNLPDPIANPKEYAQAIGQRTAEYTRNLQEHHTQVQQVKQNQNGNADQLWEDFSINYGSYAEDMEGVEFVVNKVITQAKRRGLDVDRYMYGNRDRFFQDVAKAYDTRFGKPQEDDTNNSAGPIPATRRATPAQQQEDEPANRTGGIFGGIDSGSGARPKGPAPGDLVKDLQDIQRKTGYY